MRVRERGGEWKRVGGWGGDGGVGWIVLPAAANHCNETDPN